MKPDYDTTLARIAGTIAAGNIAAGVVVNDSRSMAEASVALARAIVAEVKRTTSVPEETP